MLKILAMPYNLKMPTMHKIPDMLLRVRFSHHPVSLAMRPVSDSPGTTISSPISGMWRMRVRMCT